MAYDLLLRGARVWTGDPDRPWAEALAVTGSRIAAVGEERELRGSASRTLDLDGGLVVPGLWDAHIHLYEWALARRQVCLVGCPSGEALLERVRRGALQSTTGWLVGWGWSSAGWEDPRLPERHDLDQVVGPGRPVLLLRSDLHSALANSEALRRVGYLDRPPVLEGGEVVLGPDGSPTGLVLELALGPLRAACPPPEGPELREALAEGLAFLHSLGVTAVCDQRIKDQQEGPACLGALVRLSAEGRLGTRVRLGVALHDLEVYAERAAALQGEMLRLGHVKIFSDGSLGSRTARVLEPYDGEPDNRGLWSTPPEELADAFARCAAAGVPLSVHAIGDEANRVCLDLLERLPRRTGAPHRIEHAQILAPEDVGRFARLGLTASVQPTHLLDDMELAEAALGARADRAYRFGGLRRAGALLAFGSDAPVADPNPFLGMHAALYRQRPERSERGPWFAEERLSLEEALGAYTSGAARASGCGGCTGTLAPGSAADLAALDGDLFALEAAGARLDGVRSKLTMVGGRVVYGA